MFGKKQIRSVRYLLGNEPERIVTKFGGSEQKEVSTHCQVGTERDTTVVKN